MQEQSTVCNEKSTCLSSKQPKFKKSDIFDIFIVSCTVHFLRSDITFLHCYLSGILQCNNSPGSMYLIVYWTLKSLFSMVLFRHTCTIAIKEWVPSFELMQTNHVKKNDKSCNIIVYEPCVWPWSLNFLTHDSDRGCTCAALWDRWLMDTYLHYIQIPYATSKKWNWLWMWR